MFSTMKILKTKQRNTLSQELLEVSKRLTTWQMTIGINFQTSQCSQSNVVMVEYIKCYVHYIKSTIVNLSLCKNLRVLQIFLCIQLYKFYV